MAVVVAGKAPTPRERTATIRRLEAVAVAALVVARSAGQASLELTPEATTRPLQRPALVPVSVAPRLGLTAPTEPTATTRRLVAVVVAVLALGKQMALPMTRETAATEEHRAVAVAVAVAATEALASAVRRALAATAATARSES